MSNDWKEALECLDDQGDSHLAATIRAHIEGLEAGNKRLQAACDKWSALDSLHGAHQDLITRAEAAEARVRELEADAGRWRAMREELVAVDWSPTMGGGPVVMFSCHAKQVTPGPEGADAIADAAVEFAAIDAMLPAVRDGGEG